MVLRRASIISRMLSKHSAISVAQSSGGVIVMLWESKLQAAASGHGGRKDAGWGPIGQGHASHRTLP